MADFTLDKSEWTDAMVMAYDEAKNKILCGFYAEEHTDDEIELIEEAEKHLIEVYSDF